MVGRLVPGVLAALLLLTGCARVAGAGPDAPAADELDGRTFLSTGATDAGAPRPLVSGTRVRLTFRQGQVAATQGCNHLGGAYHLDGTALVVGDLAMTDMGCDAARNQQDQWMAALLTGRPTVTLTGDALVLTGAQSELKLQDRRTADPDRLLVGPRWRVESILSGDSASSSARQAFFVFGDGATNRVAPAVTSSTAHSPPPGPSSPSPSCR